MRGPDTHGSKAGNEWGMGAFAPGVSNMVHAFPADGRQLVRRIMDVFQPRHEIIVRLLLRAFLQRHRIIGMVVALAASRGRGETG
jgi:hypothetical protein